MANQKVHQFLTCVLNSNLKDAQEMLLQDPGLACETQTIGEHKQVTGLQLARDLGDAGMLEMMLECIVGKVTVRALA